MVTEFDCAIVGGGLAGLQAAVQLGRYRHRAVVFDSGDGRSALCRCYHNILGWPDGVSGGRLRQLGRLQAERLGAVFVDARVRHAEHRRAGSFVLSTEGGDSYEAKRVLLATGVVDRIPLKPQLLSCLGVSVFICPDCDGYETAGRRTLVFGSGNAGASMAVTLRYWTDDLIYINHERTPIDADMWGKLVREGIAYVEDSIAEIVHSEGRLQGVRLAGSGEFVAGTHAFTAFGGNEVQTELAKQLGARLTPNGHIEVDPRTKMTTSMHVWAAGDVTAHSEQAAIAMGDGSQAAIWIHKSLLL